MEPWFSEHLSSATLWESSSKIIIQFKQEDTLSINSWFPDVLTLQQSKYDLKTFWKTLIWLSKVGQEEERNNPSSQMKQRHLRLKRLVAIFLEIQQKAQSRLCCQQPRVFLFFLLCCHFDQSRLLCDFQLWIPTNNSTVFVTQCWCWSKLVAPHGFAFFLSSNNMTHLHMPPQAQVSPSFRHLTLLVPYF